MTKYEIQVFDGRYYVYKCPVRCKCCGHTPQLMSRVGPEDGFRSYQLAQDYKGTLND